MLNTGAFNFLKCEHAAEWGRSSGTFLLEDGDSVKKKTKNKFSLLQFAKVFMTESQHLQNPEQLICILQCGVTYRCNPEKRRLLTHNTGANAD